MTWKCHICGKERPNAAISVFQSDLSGRHGLPAGTMKMNVRYCNDRLACVEAAPTWDLTKKKEEQ